MPPEHHHDHHHHHHHHHHQVSVGRVFQIGIALNLLFVVVEAIFGWLSNSVALLADASHNFSDVLGLVLAWGAASLANRLPSLRFTYGLRRSGLLAALLNGCLVMAAVLVIVVEAVLRLLQPEPVVSATVMAVAAVGIVVNGVSAWLLHRQDQGDLNLRAAFLHMITDMLVSVSVVVAGALLWLTNWSWIDPLLSLLISGVIMIGTWRLLKDAVRLILDGVPPTIDLALVRDFLLEQQGVSALHDLHVWALGSQHHALSGHLVIPAGHPGDDFLLSMRDQLKSRFAIDHVTLQIETTALDDGCVG